MKRQAGKQFYKLVVTAWLAFSFGSVILALVSWAQLSARIGEGGQINQTHEALDGILESLLDLETGERGYIITGNKSFLEPFNQAETNLPSQFDRVVALVHDDPPMLESVTKLRADVQLSIDWQHQVISHARKKLRQGGGDGFHGQAQRYDG